MLYKERIVIAAAVTALMTPACNRPDPAREQAAPAAREDAATSELQRRRSDETATMEKRVVDLERRWQDMESKLAEKGAAPTAALRAEVKEDVNNVRQAVADLKTTTPENWWERHERTMERTAADIEADVRRFTKGQPAVSVQEPKTPVQAEPFESRRDRFVTQLRARVDAMEEQLKTVRARGAQETELEDTRARVNKLKEDVDRLGNASADDWWEITSKRVSEYIDRVEPSIRRLDDVKI